MKPTAFLPAVLLLTTCASFAQSTQTQKNPVSDSVRNILQRASKNMVAAAEEMPGDKYNYHPTPDQITFAHLVMHMAGSNNLLCAKISGQSAPAEEKLTDTDSKDKLVAALKSSFEFCTQAMTKVDDSNLSEEMTLFGGHKATRAAAMFALTNDFADHYSAAAGYLRLNGLLPPTAQKKQ